MLLNEPTTDSHHPASVIGQSIRFGGAFYDFSSLVPLYGSHFVFVLLIQFTEAFFQNASNGNAKRIQALRSFFKFVAIEAMIIPNSAAARAHQKLSSCIRPSESDMNELAENYGDVIRDFTDASILKSTNKTYRSTHLESVSAVLRRLAPHGLWPLTQPIRRIDDRAGSHILTLGQLGLGRTTVAFKGLDAYARSVAASKTRMAHLRKLSEEGLLQAYAVFERGKHLLARKDTASLKVITQAVSELTAYGSNQHEPLIVDRVFPKRNPDLRLGNLLKYLDAKTGGAIPYTTDPGGSYGLTLLVAACGGGQLISAHLQGTKFALLCAQLITLIDTGMNVQPCVDMAAQPFNGEFRRGSVSLLTIVATKDRPTQKEVLSTVPIEGAEALLNVAGFKLSTKSAISMWQEMSERPRSRAKNQRDNVHRYLWICPKGSGNFGRIQQFSAGVAKSQMNLFLKSIADDPVLGGLQFSRNNIRPTYLTIRNSKNLENQVVVSLANHSDGRVTFGTYLNRAEYRELLASLMRRFQNQLEAAILVTDISRVVHLSVNAETIVGWAEEAVQNGLDEILFDASNARTEAIAAAPPVEIVPERLESFLQFAPKHDDLVALILINRGMKASEEAFLVNNPQRWKHKWMPGLALTSAAIARLEQSKHHVALKRASHAADQGILDGSLRTFKPW